MRLPKTVLRNTTAAQTANSTAIQTPGATSSHGGLGNITNNSFNQVPGMLTVCSPASHFAVPRPTPSMPSVAMNGTTFKRVITNPLTVPTNPPTRIPATSATDGDSPDLIPSAVTTPVSAMVEPTARSIPPLIMIIVIPVAPMATMTVCERTMRRLFGDRKRAGVSINIEKMPITSSNPSNGPRRLSQFCSTLELSSVRFGFTSATISALYHEI